ncbi:MAG: hypothetical protein B7733_16975 [Myxococcales bacterium FL481]|nr:MAG: hypothetical protein B7733_16975 [Myxococcales bacterium FL481]
MPTHFKGKKAAFLEAGRFRVWEMEDDGFSDGTQISLAPGSPYEQEVRSTWTAITDEMLDRAKLLAADRGLALDANT